MISGLKKWARRITIGLAVLYPVSLLLIIIVLRAYGDSSWIVRLALYIPRVAFAAPLPFLVAALAAFRAWRYQLTQAAALLLILFPLMGLVLPWPTFADRDKPVIRVMTYNVNSGAWGWDKVMGQIDAYKPDVVLIQEIMGNPEEGVQRLKQRYAAVEASTQFIVASRFPIHITVNPERLPLDGRKRSPRFLRHVMETPLGPVAFYNIHPMSPRAGFWALRRGGFKNGLLNGSLLRGENARKLQDEGRLRDLQVQALSEAASKETIPVVIGGDTNLPALSPALSYLSPFRDGFRAAGWGFGYTYPVGWRGWMRLDRLYANRQLRFVGFWVGNHSWASDHHCVVADLQRRTP